MEWEQKKTKKTKIEDFEFFTSKTNEILICRWNDNNIVSIAANNYNLNLMHGILRYARNEKNYCFTA